MRRWIWIFLTIIAVPGLASARNHRVVIASSGTTTAEFRLEPTECVTGIHMDSDWTAGNIEWECAEESGGDFQAVVDSNGTLIVGATAPASDENVDLTPTGNQFCGCEFGKLVSSVTQTNEQEIFLVISR